MGKAIIVTGTPGTGKTIISFELAKDLGALYLSLNKYLQKHGLHSDFDRERRSFVADLKRTRNHLGQFVRTTPGTLVIDSNIPDILTPKTLVARVLVLRTHPRVLEKRLRKRGWTSRKVRENTLAEILDLCYADAVRYYGKRKVSQINTSKMNLQRLVRLIRSHEKRSPVRVDWLTALQKEGLIERYLG